jgi:hypothetical protein
VNHRKLHPLNEALHTFSESHCLLCRLTRIIHEEQVAGLDSGAGPEDLRKPTKNRRLQDVRGASGMADQGGRPQAGEGPVKAGQRRSGLPEESLGPAPHE